MRRKERSVLTIETKSEAETILLGKALSSVIVPPILIALMGELGSGKTTLVKGIAMGFGINRIRSPSFIIIQKYCGKVPFYHVDLYRIGDVDELISLGLLDVLYTFRGVVVVEWAEKAKSILPENRLDIKLEIIGKKERKITISGHGDEGKTILKHFYDTRGQK